MSVINFINTQNILILEKFRLKVARILLRRKSKKAKRQKMLFDFASAKYIGILCSPQDEISTRHLKDFLQYLSQKGIQYLVFGYFDGKKIPDNFLYWKGVDFMTHQDLNFFLIPNNQVVGKFIHEPFDMLIDCNMINYFPVEYVAQLSVAKCKVGVMREGELCYDLMIDIKKNRTIEYFLKNIEKYFSDLKHLNSQT